MFNQLNQKPKIAHLVNPVLVSRDSSLFVAQTFTFESMKVARTFARNSGYSVELFSAQFPEDRAFVPPYLTATTDLTQSILDCATFSVERKLPLIKDLLDSLYKGSSADYFIYTNVDIILHPYFYICVVKFIESGLDAFVINRRTICANYSSIEELPLIYTEVGRSHPGFDCFVFKKDVYPQYHLGNTCIGIQYVGKVLLLNLIAHAERFQLFKNKHLTFHLGDERNWNLVQYSDYTQHNQRQLYKVRNHLDPLLRRKKLNFSR